MNRHERNKRIVVWRGHTPDGHSLIIEREPTGHWTSTVAAAIRSRNTSLETTIIEAAGPTTPRTWASNLAATLALRSDSANGLTRR